MSHATAEVRDEFFESLLGDFLDESAQLLERLNERLLELDQWAAALDPGQPACCDLDLLNDMFRAAHSIKGLSAMLGLAEINELTHKIENVLDAARNESFSINSRVCEVLFQAYDRLVALIERLSDPARPEVACLEVVEAMQQMLAEAGLDRQQTSQADAERALSELLPEATSSPDTAQPQATTVEQAPPEEHAAATPHEAAAPHPAAVADSAATADDGAEAVSISDERLAAREHWSAIVDEAQVPAKYLPIFIDETELSLDSLTEALLTAESQGRAATVEHLLIVAHRIKGSAAAIGLHRPATLAHHMEDLLQSRLDRGQPLSPEMVDALLKCTDGLRTYVEQLRLGQTTSLPLGDWIEGLHAAERRDLESAPVESRGDDPSCTDNETRLGKGIGNQFRPGQETCLETVIRIDDQSRRAALERSVPAGASGVAGWVRFLPDFPLTGLKGRLIFEKLSRHGEILYSEPTREAVESLDALDHLAFVVRTAATPLAIEPDLHIGGVTEVRLWPLGAAAEAGTATPASGSSGPTSPDAQRGSSAKIHPSGSRAPGNGAVDLGAPGTSTTPTSSSSPQPSAVAASAESAAAIEPVPHTPAVAATQPAAGAPRANQPPTTKAPASATAPASVTASASTTAPAAGKADADSAAGRPTETLRVDIERLDQLMNLAGQLVINKARFAQIGEGLKPLLSRQRAAGALDEIAQLLGKLTDVASLGDARRIQQELEGLLPQARRAHDGLEAVRGSIAQMQHTRRHVSSLLDAVHQLDRVADGIQKSVMDTRMVPIGPLFGRFRRVIRDITRANRKDIQLIIRGEKTELDKRMIDELGDPLIHMVRNSADHGIEPPEARVAAGKTPQGSVALDAFHRGNHIYIQVRDDGKGLDPERIAAKAVEKGLVQPADVERLSRQQIFALIWEPGFSTAEKVTEISGRGMGMDIVKSKIEGLNGSVELDSEPGHGTTFTIKLPLTLAILPSLLARIDGDVYALPIESVVEIVRVEPEFLSTVHGQPTARVRGRVVSVVDLAHLFTWQAPATLARRSGERTLVIIGQEGREIGLAVDQLLGEEDVVIKSMAENYRHVPGIAGASILGDGRVSLILDTGAVIEMASRGGAADAPHSAAERAATVAAVAANLGEGENAP